ncbi:Site-specific DNA recombinase [Paenibacillus sophorae]|uniref:Recombinase family protein n=1 Tax=Paenibacillus sophorae TaxID=1333845 RepID=A0A1H8GDR1_9BACL|nr:recombinase family protein [Paenibacillus sophorae]QWU14187.1 recombinase family protein [Paenibacillus sophorae]SEN42152.1 Site-specific DNA recombinase [Paenibacillus sophorae]
MITEKIPVCAYCRVSTEHESQLNSLDNQTYYFEEKTEKSGKYELYRIYADQGLSATSWKKREYFKEMLADAGLDIEIHRKEIKAYVSNREPRFRRILIKDVSRFSRNASEGLELVTKLREKNVHIDFVSLGLSTEQMTNDMIIGFFLLAAENESKDRSQKVLWGKKMGAEKGVIHTTDNFYGYKYIKDTNTLEIIEEEATNIRLIFDLYVNHNYGFRKIIKHLNDNNIFTRRGKSFVPQSIKRILENVAYTGDLVRNKMDSPKVFTSKSYATYKPKSEWLITKDRIPQIIEPELLAKSIEIRRSKLHYKQRVGIYNGLSEYSGLIVCGSCGCNYTKNREARTGYDFYNCRTKKYKGRKYCQNINVSLKQIEETIRVLADGKFYDAILKDKNKNIEKIEDEITEIKKRMNQQSVKEVENLREELKLLNEENNRLAVLFVKGNIDEDYLNTLQREIDEKVSKLIIEIKEKSMDNNQLEEEILRLKNTVTDLSNLEIKDKYTVHEIKDQISNIRVHRDKDNNKKAHLEIRFKVFENIAGIMHDFQ